MTIFQSDAYFYSSLPIRGFRQVAPGKLEFPMESNAGRRKRREPAREEFSFGSDLDCHAAEPGAQTVVVVESHLGQDR